MTRPVPRFLSPLVGLLGLILLTAASASGAVVDDVLARWLRAWQSGLALEPRAVEAYTSELERAVVAARSDAEARTRLRTTLVDTLAVAAPPPPRSELFEGTLVAAPDGARTPGDALRDAARDALRADSGAYDWLCTEVLPSLAAHPVARRRAALGWLLERPRPTLATALLVVGRRADDPLRPDALSALARWAATEGANDAIDLFLVSLLGRGERADARPHPFGLLQERILSCATPLGAAATDLLRERATAMLQSADWRQAARAIQLLRGMELEVRVTLLLDALSLWVRRAEGGGAGPERGSKRIEGDLVAELQRISGKSIGANPRNWIAWWVAVRQGRIEPVDPEADGDGEERTRAAFFGLRASTDRVTFVIDHSGSMGAAFGTHTAAGTRTRYERAIDELTRFLQANGPETHFNIVLFSDTPLRSSTELVPASPENLERARASLLARPPGGGTFLVPALELALCVGPGGHVDLDQFTADTVIVLCDGEIAEGSAWVAPLMQRVAAETQVRFHCVLIGSHGGAALQELARLSGGECVRTEG